MNSEEKNSIERRPEARPGVRLEARIERLEAQNRRMKLGALVCVVAVASIGLMGQTQTQTTTTQHKTTTKKTPAPAAAPAAPAAPAVPEKIEAESFVLKDQAGRARADLAMGGTGPSFRLLDQNGSALVTIALNDGAPGGPMVLLSDPGHHAGLTMSVLQSAGPQMSLTGEGQSAQVHMGVTKDGTAVELYDQDGFSTSLGNGTKVSKDGKAKETTAASIALYNKDRKLLWSAP